MPAFARCRIASAAKSACRARVQRRVRWRRYVDAARYAARQEFTVVRCRADAATRRFAVMLMLRHDATSIADDDAGMPPRLRSV